MTDHPTDHPSRRHFLRSSALALGGLALPMQAPASILSFGANATRRILRGSTDVHIDVLPFEPVGAVTRNHYGHFIEHLGGVIYDGVWVGEKSKIPNIDGIRKSLVDDLRALTPGVVRWPGGCFADSYDWLDGIGTRGKRPRRTSFWTVTMDPKVKSGPARYEPNQFGTPEFLRFCKLVGADPYLAVNMRSRTALDFAHWVEYCNAPRGTTTLAEQREADGSPEPYNVRFWGVGNEPWACGGTMEPEEYAQEFRKFTSWIPVYPQDDNTRGLRPLLIAAGPNEDDYAWTRKFFASMTSRFADEPYGMSVHEYFGRRDRATFETAGWYGMLQSPRTYTDMILRHADIIRTAGAKTTLVLDEWGAWYGGDTGRTDPSHLYEQIPTLRDALVTSLMFDTFQRHVDVVGMATVAQTVNCLHALFLAKEEKYIRTPVYHAFALYQPHIGGTSVRTVAAAERITFPNGKDPKVTEWIDGVSTSATRHDGTDGTPKRIVLTMTNPHMDQPSAATIALHGVTVKSGEITRLTHPDVHAQNTFDAPNIVALSTPETLLLPTSASTRPLTVILPPASVTRVICTLG